MRSLQTRLASILSPFPENRVFVGSSRSSHVTVLVKNAFLFQPGQSVLTADSSLLLDRLASFLRTYSNDVQVVGHVALGDRGASGDRSAWQLSAERAGKVVAHLVDHYGFSPERFTVQAFGSSAPLVPGREAGDLKTNNRLELRIMAPGITRSEAARQAAGPSA
jgi:chemotaxis protein MotB